MTALHNGHFLSVDPGGRLALFVRRGVRIGVAALIAAGLALVAAWPAAGQAPGATAALGANTPDKPVTIVSFGGLLGQWDGFCEEPATEFYRDTTEKLLPCLPKDGAKDGKKDVWPAALGGLVGIREKIEAKKENWPGAFLVLQADNQLPDFADTRTPVRVGLAQGPEQQARIQQVPVQKSYADKYWDGIAKLGPRAVGLGAEDFHRSLRVSRTIREASDADPSDTAARRFVTWVRGRLGAPEPVPFLASNIVVKTRQRDVNKVEDAAMPYRLVLDEDVSAGWLRELQIEHPCGDDRFELWRGGARISTLEKKAGSSREAVECKDSEDQTTTYTIGGGLDPATTYGIHSVKQAKTFATFRTSSALTPHAGGWPVIVDWQGKAPESGASPLVIVSLASETFSHALGKAAWQWKPSRSVSASSTGTQGDGDVCATDGTAAKVRPKTTCEIAFLEPKKVLEAILGRIEKEREPATKPADPTQKARELPPPFVVLVAALLDDEILAITDEFPEIRLVIAPPESGVLGRTRRADDEAKISGDLGTIGVLDGNHPETTRLVVRPEWVGETIATVKLTPKTAHAGWALEPASAKIQLVPGHPLAPQPEPGDMVSYGPYGIGNPGSTSPAYKPYLPCKASDRGPRCQAFRALWTNQSTFVAVLGDALRGSAGADLAVVPSTLVDTDVIDWLKKSVPEKSTEWLTLFLLQRAAYRSARFVRADVSGEELLGVLQKALDDPLETGDEFCVSGLGAKTGCPETLKDEKIEDLRPKGRVVSPTSFYTVVLPDRLAEHLGLKHGDDDAWDAVEALDAHLTARGDDSWYPWQDLTGQTSVDDAGGALVERLENRRVGEPRSYLKVRDAEIGWTNFDVDGPNGAESVPGNVDVDFANAKSLSTLVAAAKIDAGAIDLKRQALRGIAEIDFSRRTEPGSDLVSYERNKFLAGVRADLWKIRRFGDLRFFTGYFWEGPLERITTEITPTRPIGTREEGGITFTQTESPGFKVPYVVERNVFSYWSLGSDMYTSAALSRLLPHWTRVPLLGKLDLSVTRLKLQGDHGEASRVPLELQLGEWRLGSLRAACPSDANNGLRNGDAGAFLSATFACRPDVLMPSDRQLSIVSEPRTQQRLQVEVDGAVSAKFGDRTYKLNIGYERRWYSVDGGQIDLAVREARELKLQLTFPLFWRFELAPTYERQRVEIFAPANNQYSVDRWDIRVKLPFFATFGRDGLVQ